MQKAKYKKELKDLQKELVQLQQWVIREGKRVIIIFEGRDAAGKGGMVQRIVQRLNTNKCRVEASSKPTAIEERQKYFTRWRKKLPASGEMVLFDRSWYTRAGVESVMGFATGGEVDTFYSDVKKFERKLTKEGVIVLKYWLSITHREQEKRFEARLNNPMKRWKLSPMDLACRNKYVEFTRAKERMFKETNFKFCGWKIIDSNCKRESRLVCIDDILQSIPYEAKELVPSSLAPIQIPEDTRKESFDHLIVR